MGVIFAIIVSIFVIWQMTKRAIEIGTVDEQLDGEVQEVEDERAYEVADLFDLRDHPDESQSEQVSSTPKKREPTFQEGRGFIFTETTFVSDDGVQLEVIEEDESEVGGLDSAFIHDALRNDLRTSIVLKEVLDPKYNRRE